jgi:hypothetical protein
MLTVPEPLSIQTTLNEVMAATGSLPTSEQTTRMQRRHKRPYESDRLPRQGRGDSQAICRIRCMIRVFPAIGVADIANRASACATLTISDPAMPPALPTQLCVAFGLTHAEA